MRRVVPTALGPSVRLKNQTPSHFAFEQTALRLGSCIGDQLCSDVTSGMPLCRRKS